MNKWVVISLMSLGLLTSFNISRVGLFIDLWLAILVRVLLFIIFVFALVKARHQ